MPVGGGLEKQLSITSPDQGILRIGVQERGVSLVASLDGDPRTDSASPVDRLGTLVLVANTAANQNHSLQIRAEDSPDITGTVCVTADLIRKTDDARVKAEQAFASAGHSTHNEDWGAAFNQYLQAARAFDGLGLRRSSAASRQAMAEIAYLRLDRKRDSFALASEALNEYGVNADPMLLGPLTGLQGKALLDMPGAELDPLAIASRVRRLLAGARRYDLAMTYGVREVPRLDIMSGFLEFMLDNPTRAREVFATAARTCREMHDWVCYAIANQNLAHFDAESNNYAAALSAYADALQALPPELDPKMSATIWTNYGRLQGTAGLLGSAERSQQTALRDYARLGDCPGFRRSLSWSGNLLVQTGNLGDAEDYLQQAAAAKCSELLATDTQGDPAQGAAPVPTIQRSGTVRSPIRPDLCTQPLDPNSLGLDDKLVVFNSLLSLGGALTLEGNPVLAQRCIDAAGPYAVTARTRMRLANERGSMRLERNDPRGARVLFMQSLQIADAAKLPAKYEYRGIAQLGLLRSALLSGNTGSAVTDGIQALQASVGRGDIDQTVTSLRLLAAGFLGSRRPADAAHELQTAADLIEAVPIDQLDGEKRATYLATQHTVFAELTDLYASQAAADPQEAWLAFETSERGRARSLRFAISQQTQAASPLPDAPPEARYQQLLHEVAALANSAGAGNLTESLDSVALREQRPSEPLDRARLTGTLKQLDATLIEYAVGARDMFAIVLNDRGAFVVRLGDKHEIDSTAAAMQDLLRDPETPPSEVSAAARQLASKVLWPLASHLTAKRIILVPDEALHTIPFDVLPWSANTADQLVLHHAEVSVVPSALFLTRIQSTRPVHNNAPRIELIGDPVFRIPDWRHECIDTIPKKTGVAQSAVRSAEEWTESLPRLPGTRTEVQMIARLAKQSHPGSHVETLLGCAAVPSALRQAASENVDLLHVATHARVDAQRPRLSALALTPEGTGNLQVSGFGLLDILGLKLNSSLVVLSACETSRGRLLPGEGVLGPAQAFLQAGASAVLASYWRVDDEAASDFMQRFYKYLLMDHLPAATALRKAQLDRAAATGTFDWAAFALYGWPESSI